MDSTHQPVQEGQEGALATRNEDTSAQSELAVMRMHFSMLQKGVRPSTTPTSGTACDSSVSVMRSTCGPRNVLSPDKPTWPHTGGDEPVVTGHRQDPDAVRRQRLQRRCGRFLRRVGEGDVTDQRQVCLVGDRAGGLAGRKFLHGHRDDAQPFFVEFARDLPHANQHGRVERQLLRTVAVIDAHAGARRQHLPERGLADRRMVLVASCHHERHHDRHAKALEVERDLVDLAVVRLQLQLGLQLHMFEHRMVEQGFQPCLAVAVQIGEFRHLFRRLAEDVGVSRERDLVLGQRASLAGAEQVHRAEVLDRVQTLDDGLSA